jgi:purine-binding chemotaxis protein CheW
MTALAGAEHLFCTLRLAGRLFGVSIHEVKEVNPETRCTRIPHTPPTVAGYANLRGQIHLIVDLRQLLALSAIAVTPESRLLIFKPQVADQLGVLVDQVGDIVAVTNDQLEPWRGDPHAPSELIERVAKLNGELLLILSARQIVQVVATTLRMKDEG